MIPVKVILLVFFFGGAISALPEGWKACKQSSADYEDCTKKQIKTALVSLKNGDRKLGVIPLDPLHFDEMDMEQGTGPVSVVLKLRNVNIEGISKAEVTSFKNDWKKMTVTLLVPLIHIVGDYTINGQILVLPISGSGQAVMDWEELEYTLDMNLKPVTKDGKKYYQVEKMQVFVSPKKLSFNFDNLFNGNKELGTTTNKFLNEHWQEILKELKPALSRTLEVGYKEYINRLLAKIPAEEIDVK